MPGDVTSVTDMFGLDDVAEDVTQKAGRSEPVSVENEKLADSSRTANKESAPAVTVEAGAREKGAAASGDPDADVSPAVVVCHAIRAKVEHSASWPRSGEVQKPGLRKRTRSC
jgi:hypothetical protein